MKKALIVGGGGFVGGYLIERLKKSGKAVYVTKLPVERIEQTDGVAKIYDLDVADAAAVRDVLSDCAPDEIYHLAAVSSVKVSWEKPELTAKVNVLGAISLLEGVRAVCPSARVIVVGSSEEYGKIDYAVPVKEDALPAPQNVYAVTKLTQEYLAQVYHAAYGLNVVSTRSFNHIGPRQAPQFVVADFCKQTAMIERGECEPVIRVGNLSAKRDFTDVRDVVRAYELLAEKGNAGETYNVGSGKSIAVEEILRYILSLAKVKIEVCIDEKKFRPVDVPEIKADIAKIAAIGYAPRIDVFETVRETLEYYRTLA